MAIDVDPDADRGRVLAVLSTTEWMHCHDVAGTLEIGVVVASSALSELHRAGLVDRRETDRTYGPDYEYRRREDVQLG